MKGKFLVFTLVLLLVTACGAKPIETVYIATPCKVQMPDKPIRTDNIYINIVEILKYTELLEIALKVCRDEF